MNIGVVLEKEYKKDYEAGSGSLHIPILGDIFPKLFHQDMKPVDKYFVIVQQDSIYRYEVSQKVYETILVGDRVEIGTDKYGMPDVRLIKNDK